MARLRHTLLPILILILQRIVSIYTLRSTTLAPELDIDTELMTGLSKQCKVRSSKITDARDFLGLVKNSDAFVDKTLLLKQIMDHREKTHLITRPHKWGKSVTMDMLKLFFGLKLDKRGRPLARNRTKRYILFKYGEYTLHYGKGRQQEPFLISSKFPQFLDDHMGYYPLIHVRMEIQARGETFVSFLKSIRATISGTYLSHGYLKQAFEEASKDMQRTKTQRKKYKNYWEQFRKMASKDYVALDKLHSSFALLSKMLHDHFDRPVMILMDDYDAPVDGVIGNNTIPTAEKLKFVQFYRSFLRDTFKLNPHMKKGVLSGILRLYREDTFYEYKMGDDAGPTCIDDQFYEYFGANAIEAKWLFDNRNISNDMRGQARSLYFGYQPTNDDNPTLKIYNIHTLVGFLDEKAYANYWIEIDKLERYLNQFFKVASIKEIVTSLTFGNHVPIGRHDLRFNATDYIKLENFMNDHNRIPDDFTSLALSYLFTTGYLTAYGTTDDNQTVYLRFPNKQIAQQVKLIISRDYRLKLGVLEPKKGNSLIDQFRKFVLHDQNNTNDLAVELTKFLAPKSPRKVDQSLLRQTINYLAIHIDTLYDKFSVSSDDMPDLVLLSSQDAIIFKCTVQASSTDIAMAEAKIYEHVLQSLPNIKTVKYVGINLNPRRQAQIKVEKQPNPYYDANMTH